jgi:hypothetical protein
MFSTNIDQSQPPVWSRLGGDEKNHVESQLLQQTPDRHNNRVPLHRSQLLPMISDNVISARMDFFQK